MNTVALLVSAWIETLDWILFWINIWSHSSWVRGLKLILTLRMLRLQRSHSSWVRGLKQSPSELMSWSNCRTPRECVDWNKCNPSVLNPIFVALLVSAWIETGELLHQSSMSDKSHSSWVRGLKPYTSLVKKDPILSHSSWVRGLKQVSYYINLACLMSHSSWVRGLKHDIRLHQVLTACVALLVSAWIET